MESAMSHKFAIVVQAAILLLSGAAQAEIYKWTDAEGKVHYSNSRPPGDQAQAVSEDKLSVIPMQSTSPQTLKSMEDRMERREKDLIQERAIAAQIPAEPQTQEPYRYADSPYDPYYPYGLRNPYPDKKSRRHKDQPQVGPGPYGIGGQYVPPAPKPTRGRAASPPGLEERR
jgi:hypothetical protein